MEDQRKEKVWKNQKGSITLFVVIAMMFFMFFLLGTYINNANKNTAQLKEIEQIQAEYSKETESATIDKTYDEVVGDFSQYVAVSFETATTKKAYNVDTWTAESIEMTIKWPDEGLTSTDKDCVYIDGQKISYEDGYVIDKNCKIEIRLKRKTTRINVAKIDKEAPETAGTLNIKLDEGLFKDGMWTNQSVHISKATNGTDKGVGVKEDGSSTTYSINNGPETTEPQTLTEEGTYIAKITTTDLLGHSASKDYTIKIDKTNPICGTAVLKLNNSAGSEYTGYTNDKKENWTKENIYVEISNGYDKDNGTDKTSGHKSTTYTITKDGQTYNLDSDKIIKETGKYKITVTTMDIAGNTISNTNEIFVDKDEPTNLKVIPKLVNESGADYTPGTWTNQNVFVKLTADDNVKVDKYEWYEGNAWTTRALTTSTDEKPVGTITYTAERNTDLRFRAQDAVKNISAEATLDIKMDKTNPTLGTATVTATSSTIKLDVAGAIDKDENDKTANASGIKEYEFYIDGVKKATQATSSYTFEGLTPNKPYTIKYVVRDNAGNIVTSNGISKVTLANIPSNITATKDLNAQGQQITVNWNANSNPAGTVYELQASSDNSTWETVYTGTTTSYVHTGLKLPDSNGGSTTVRYYKVRAKNSENVYTNYTSSISGNTLKSPTVTKTITSSGVNSGLNKVTLSWSAVPGATQYGISIFDGYTYRYHDLGNVTSWDSDIAKVYPTTSQIATWNRNNDPFRWSGDGQSWKASANELYIKANSSYTEYSYYQWIHIYSKDSSGRYSGTVWSGATSKGSSTIDSDEPNSFTPNAGTTTTNSITVTGSTTDKYMTANYPGSGIRGYKFGILKNGTWEWSAEQTGTSYTFTGLTHKTTYQTKMIAYDNKGNYVETSQVAGTTKELKAGSLKLQFNDSLGTEYTQNTWTNKNIYVTKVDGEPTTANNGNVEVKTSYESLVGSAQTVVAGTMEATTISKEGTTTLRVVTTDGTNTVYSGNYIIKVDTTAPEAPTYEAYYSDGSGNYTSGTWTNKEVKTKITTKESGAGLAQIETSKDKTNWNKLNFLASNGITNSGTTYSGVENWTLKDRNEVYYFRAVDIVGNASGISTAYNIKYDITKPTTTAPTATSTTNSITVTNKQTDTTTVATSGLNNSKTKYALKTGTTWGQWQTSNVFNGLTHKTNYAVKTQVTDNAGNTMESAEYVISTQELKAGSLTFKLNNSSGVAYTPNTWTKENVYVTKVDGNGTTTFESVTGSAQTVTVGTTAATTINTEGTTTLRAKTTDGTNKVYSSNYVILIDKTAPTAGTMNMKLGSSTGANYSNNAWTNQSVYISVNNGSDTASGHKTTTYTVNGGTSTSNAQTLIGTGTYTIVVTTLDNATNSETRTYTVKIDKNKPTVPILDNSSNENWTNQDVIVSGISNDINSGIIRFEYSYDNVNWENNISSTSLGNNSWKVNGKWSEERNSVLYIRAIDNAGNISDVARTVIKIDKTAPVVTNIKITTDMNEGSILNKAKTDVVRLEGEDKENNGVKSEIVKWGITNTNTPPTKEVGGTDINYWVSGKTFTVSENTTWYAWVKDNAGNISIIKSFEINNIDTDNPAIQSASSDTKWSTSSNITVNATDKMSTISGYGVSNKNQKNLFDVDDWILYMNKLNAGIVKETVNGKEVVRYAPSVPNYTAQYMKGKFKEKTAYTFSYSSMAKDPLDSRQTTCIWIKYTDGSSAGGGYTIRDGVWRDYQFTSDANKTIEHIYMGWYYGGYTYFDNIQIEEGTTKTSYESYVQPQNWQSSNIINVVDNGMYNVYVKDEVGNISASKQVTVSNIDKEKPTVIAPTATSTTNSITTTFRQTDSTSGINASTVQYALKTGSTWGAWQTSNVFNGLTHKTTYAVKTKVTDNAGNTSESAELSIATQELRAGTLTMKLNNSSGTAYTSNTWTKENVYVTKVDGNGTTTFESVTGSAQTVAVGTTTATTINTEGTTTLRVKTTDGTNTVYSTNYVIKIDKTVPTAGTMTMKLGSSTGSNYSNNTWTNQNVYVAVNNGSDTLSGHKTTTYTVNGGAATTTAQTLSSTGTYTIVVTTTDNAGNTATNSYTIKIDKDKPTNLSITAKLNSSTGVAYNNGWTNQNVYVTLTASDNVGIGQYQWYSGENWTNSSLTTSNGTGTITFTVNRNETVRFRVIDTVGNISDEKTLVVKIDKDVPTTTLPTATSTTNSITVTNKQTDSASGINNSTIQYALKTGTTWGAWQTSATFSGLTHKTAYAVKTKVTDNAGNTAESTECSIATKELTVGSLAFRKDSSSGTVFTPRTTTTAGKVWINNNVHMTQTNGNAGTTSYQVKNGAGTVQTITSGLLTTATDTYTVIVTTTDGTNTVTRTYYLDVDKTAPVNTAPTATSTTNSITATFKQTDTHSGLNNGTVQYALKTGSTWGAWQTSATFSGLTHKTTYAVKTKVTDNAGNTSESTECSIATKELTVGSLVFRKDSSSGTVFTPRTTTTAGKVWINNNVHMTQTNGNAGTTSYQVKNGAGTVQTVTSGLLATVTDTYTVVVTTTDGTNTVTRTYYLDVDKTAPVNTAPTATSTTNSITATFKQTDAHSGLNNGTVQYALKTGSTWGAWQTSNVFNGLTHKTTYAVKTKVTDNAGNSGESAECSVTTQELRAGTLTMKLNNSSGAAYTPNTWTKENVYVTKVDGNGTTTFESVTGSAQTVAVGTTAATTINTEGTTTLRAKTTDGTNTVYSSNYIIKIDKTIPTAGTMTMKLGSSTGSNYSNDTWTNQSVYVTVNNGSDTLSGHKTTTYTVNGGAATTTAQTLSSTGTYTIVVTTTDNVGLTATRSYTVKIDKQAPTVTFATNGNTTYAKIQSTKVTVTDQGGSTVDANSLKYQWTQSTTAPTEASFTNGFTNAGTITKSDGTGDNWYLWILAKDALGNTTITKSNAFYLDNTAPVLSAITNSSGGKWTNQAITLSWTITENNSGIQKVQYSYNQSAWDDLDSTEWYKLTRSNQRNDTLYFRAIDKAGNVSNVNGSAMKIDTTLPTITVSPTSGAAAKSRSVTITAGDTGGSGLASNSYQYYLSNSSTVLSGGTWTNYTSGTATTIGTGLNGTYYLFIKRVNDNAGNTSSAGGNIITASSVSCHRFGTYIFDNTAPVWAYVSKTNATTGNTNYIKKADTITITFKGTDTNNASSTLTVNDIVVKVAGTAVVPTTKTLSTSTSVTGGVQYTLTLAGITKDGVLTVDIAAGKLTDTAGNTNAYTSLNPSIIVDNVLPYWSIYDIIINKR